MEVRLFGELEALQGGIALPVRGAKQRALLALLALQRGKPMSADRLIDHLWRDGEVANPANATGSDRPAAPEPGISGDRHL
jgi:DNA-binding SARP family transcriptional activator